MHHDFVGDRSFRRGRYNINAVFLRLGLESFIGLVKHLDLAVSYFVFSSFESTRDSLIAINDLDFSLVKLISWRVTWWSGVWHLLLNSDSCPAFALLELILIRWLIHSIQAQDKSISLLIVTILSGSFTLGGKDEFMVGIGLPCGASWKNRNLNRQIVQGLFDWSSVVRGVTHCLVQIRCVRWLTAPSSHDRRCFQSVFPSCLMTKVGLVHRVDFLKAWQRVRCLHILKRSAHGKLVAQSRWIGSKSESAFIHAIGRVTIILFFTTATYDISKVLAQVFFANFVSVERLLAHGVRFKWVWPANEQINLIRRQIVVLIEKLSGQCVGWLWILPIRRRYSWST